MSTSHTAVGPCPRRTRSLSVVAPALVTLAVLILACQEDGRRTTGACQIDQDCGAQVCFDQRCYTPCDSQAACGQDELCVRRAEEGQAVTICVITSGHAGCATDEDCADLVTGPCEVASCETPAGLCAVASRLAGAACQASGGPGRCDDGVCVPDAAPLDVVTPSDTSGSSDAGPQDALVEVDATPDPWADAAPGAWRPMSEDGAPAARKTEGACHRPGAEAWRAMSSEGAPGLGDGPAVTPVAGGLCYFAGASADDAPGACYVPRSDSWLTLPAQDAPSARVEPSVAWTGTDLCVWGGVEGSAPVATGACLPILLGAEVANGAAEPAR
jgi:hypothetical protein